MESVKKARQRLQLYPKLLASCGPAGKDYARCVALKDNVLKGDCEKEFIAFKICLQKEARRMSTRM